MWYLEEEVEAGMFDEDGLRIRRAAGQNVQPVDLSVNPIPRDMKKVRDQVRPCIDAPARCAAFRAG